MKFNIILHVTTSCNYNCSYCDVIKDKRWLSSDNLKAILKFINRNKKYISRFKFFGGEPLLAWFDIKSIIDNSFIYIGANFEIVTNTSLLNDEIGEYFKKYFKIIFFSIDSENNFYYDKVYKFIKKYNLEDKIYFNLVISPNREQHALKQFLKLYNLGFKGFNILPVYITKIWNEKNLRNLSRIMKDILDLSLKDSNLKLYGFQENLGEDLKLANNTIFINIDGNIYYSDIVSTFKGNSIKDKLYLGNIEEFNLENVQKYDFLKEKIFIRKLEKKIYNEVRGQKKLNDLMNYFSVYLNNEKGIKS